MALTTLSDNLAIDLVWLYLPLSNANLYKITALGSAFLSNGQQLNRRYEIGQFDELGNGYNLRSIRAEPFPQVFFLEKPKFFQSQRLGIRLANSSIPFLVKIEADEMAVFNDNQTTQIATSVAKNFAAASVVQFVACAANPSRIGAIIRNNTNRVVYLDFDGAVTVTDFAVQLAVGAAYEFPVTFTGEIVAICAGAAAGITGGVNTTQYVA